MAERPYEQGPPSPDQLPKGAAQDLNAGAALADQATAQNPPMQIQKQPFNPADHAPVPLGPQDNGLFGPDTSGLPPTAGIGRNVDSSPPENIGQILPGLVRAAQAPDAPASVKALLALVLQQIGSK